MAQRRTLGDNPLDLIVPKRASKAKKRKARRAEAPVKKSKIRPAKAVEEATATVSAEVPQVGRTEKPVPAARPAKEVEPAVKASAEVVEAPAEAPIPAPDRKPAEKPAARQPVAALPGQYLTFFLGGEEYGAGILQVKEIIEYDTLTTVPTTPPWIRGVINLRGSVVPVIDLAVKFGLAKTAVTSRTCIVIVEVELEGESTDMGVMVDSVSQVVELSAEEIEPAPAFGTRIHVDYLQGMGRLGEKFVLLLDVDRVLSSDELMTASVVTAAAPVAEDGTAPSDELPVTS